MPISPEAWAAYGPDWPEYSFNIAWRRAKGRCECSGECAGPNGHLDPIDGRCRNRHGQPRWRGNWWQRPVILSVAHLDHDVSNHDPNNLFACCEACHLRMDASQHWATRRRNQEKRLGLIPLF